MHPKLRHLEQVVAKTQVVDKFLRVTGGAPGPRLQVRVGRWILLGTLGDVPIEDDDPAQQEIPQVSPRKHG